VKDSCPPFRRTCTSTASGAENPIHHWAQFHPWFIKGSSMVDEWLINNPDFWKEHQVNSLKLNHIETIQLMTLMEFTAANLVPAFTG
jgi:hypothetical protein